MNVRKESAPNIVTSDINIKAGEESVTLDLTKLRSEDSKGVVSPDVKCDVAVTDGKFQRTDDASANTAIKEFTRWNNRIGRGASKCFWFI